MSSAEKSSGVFAMQSAKEVKIATARLKMVITLKNSNTITTLKMNLCGTWGKYG
jgi:hypothetical protein